VSGTLLGLSLVFNVAGLVTIRNNKANKQ